MHPLALKASKGSAFQYRGSISERIAAINQLQGEQTSLLQRLIKKAKESYYATVHK